ncbi:hypothetical protein Patl1_18420 [Pistacia atlantica]|uniref:Uncharacterized protein n=1 Tax=Pistacia atlantica TaxID=434234 RepID=A0ACC1BZZ6_9ROSI|nr:hypothetical protein Patl1_18420 [Pistacia atlantica]
MGKCQRLLLCLSKQNRVCYIELISQLKYSTISKSLI